MSKAPELRSMPADLLTVAEVAKRLKLTDDSVLSLIHAGRIAASNVGLGSSRPRWRISAEALDTFLESRKPTPPAKRTRRNREAAVIEFF